MKEETTMDDQKKCVASVYIAKDSNDIQFSSTDLFGGRGGF